MKRIFILLLLPIHFIFADSVYLLNDSPFELIAQIISANGRTIGQVTFKPGEQSTWTTDQTRTKLDVQFDEDSSYTPFTVIWRCSYEGFYSMCSNVSAGATVTANSCQGPRYCKPKPKKNADGSTEETSCNGCIKIH